MTHPFGTASPMVCESARPADRRGRLAQVCAHARNVQVHVSFTILNVNNASGSTENMTSGGSMRCGATIIAADQHSAATLNSS